MTTMATAPEYSHTQKAPLCLLLYALAVAFLVLGFTVPDAPLLPWLFPPLGLLMLMLAVSFHHLTVADQGDGLAISFGPLPVFRRTVKYADIETAEVSRTQVLDGWGIHLSIRGGWVWNLWGRTCVAVHFKHGGMLRIGTDDAENLAEFVRRKVQA